MGNTRGRPEAVPTVRALNPFDGIVHAARIVTLGAPASEALKVRSPNAARARGGA
jgi:hypothetical protein